MTLKKTDGEEKKMGDYHNGKLSKKERGLVIFWCFCIVLWSIWVIMTGGL